MVKSDRRTAPRTCFIRGSPTEDARNSLTDAQDAHGVITDACSICATGMEWEGETSSSRESCCPAYDVLEEEPWPEDEDWEDEDPGDPV